MIKLSIDTSDRYMMRVDLLADNKKPITKRKKTMRSQVLLPLITKILEENELGLKDLSGIDVNLGPGSFTGIRVGVSVANAMGYALKIPINGEKIGDLVEPKYK